MLSGALISLFSYYVGCFFIRNGDIGSLTCSSFNEVLKTEVPSEVRLRDLTVLSTEQAIVIKKQLLKIPTVETITATNGFYDIEDGALLVAKELKYFRCTDCNMTVIRENMFSHPKLQSIFMYSSGVIELRKGAFRNGPKLYEFSLTNNKVRVIHRGVFTGTSFHRLFLDGNEIGSIENGAFSDMDNLEILNLGHNYLKTFDSSLAIDKAPKLEYLYLNSNELSSFDLESVANLEHLNISYNNIEDLGRAFENYTDLISLDMSHNKVKVLDPRLFNKTNMVQYLFLHDNQLSSLPDEILEYFGKFAKITSRGNPWECPFEKKLRAWAEEKDVRDGCESAVCEKAQERECYIREYFWAYLL